MPKYIITYTDEVYADDIEQAKDILMEQLSMDVRADDASAFEITLDPTSDVLIEEKHNGD